MDIHPLRYKEPGNLLERNQDLQNEVETLNENLENLRRAQWAVPTPDLASAHAEISNLKAQEARCQKQREDLENQITSLNDLSAMTDDDEKSALRDQVDDFRDRLRATQLERDDLNLKISQLHQQRLADIAVLQAVHTESAQAHHDLSLMREAPDANSQPDQPVHGDHETADAALRRLCAQLKDELRKMATIPGITAIPRLINMIPEDGGYLGVDNLAQFIRIWAIWLDILLKQLGNKTAVPIDLKCMEVKLDIKFLCNELKRVLVEIGKLKPGAEVTVRDIGELIKQVPSIIRHEETLRSRIAQLEADKECGGFIQNEAYEAALKNLHNQSRAALLQIGQEAEPSPDYGVSNFIDDATQYIQILQGSVPTLQREQKADNFMENSEALPQTDMRRVGEFRIYNALVNSYQELYHIIAVDHFNEEQPPGIGGKEQELKERDIADPSSFVTPLDINLLGQSVEAFLSFIRTRSWPGSQPDWIVSEANFEHVKVLSLALERAGHSIAQARASFDGLGLAYETDKNPVDETPEMSATSHTFEGVMSAYFALLLQLKFLWSTVSEIIYPEIPFPEGITEEEDSETVNMDDLHKVRLRMANLIRTIHGQEQPAGGKNTPTFVFGSVAHMKRIMLQHLLSAAYAALAQAEEELEGYIPSEHNSTTSGSGGPAIALAFPAVQISQFGSQFQAQLQGTTAPAPRSKKLWPLAPDFVPGIPAQYPQPGPVSQGINNASTTALAGPTTSFLPSLNILGPSGGIIQPGFHTSESYSGAPAQISFSSILQPDPQPAMNGPAPASVENPLYYSYDVLGPDGISQLTAPGKANPGMNTGLLNNWKSVHFDLPPGSSDLDERSSERVEDKSQTILEVATSSSEKQKAKAAVEYAGEEEEL
jgi:hypothetical protein